MTAQQWRFPLVGLIALGMAVLGIAACSFFGASEFDEELGPRLATLSGQSVFDRLVAGSAPAVVYVGAAGVHRIDPERGTVQALVPADGCSVHRC